MSRRSWLLFAALGIIWGMPYFFIKVALLEISPFVVAFGRIFIAALILVPIAWHRGVLRGMRTHVAPLVAFACIEIAIPFTAISVGEQWVASSVAGMLIALVPLSVAVISRFFGLHESLGPLRLAGLLIGLGGVGLLLGFGTVAGPLGWGGAACMLLATLGYAAGPLIVQRYLGDIDSLAAVAVSLVIASILMAPAALLHLPRALPSLLSMGSVLFLGVVCTSIAMLLMFKLVALVGAARSSVITYINPAVATLLGVLILHEPFGWTSAVAFALILLGSWLATVGGRRQAISVRSESRDPAV